MKRLLVVGAGRREYSRRPFRSMTQEDQHTRQAECQVRGMKVAADLAECSVVHHALLSENAKVHRRHKVRCVAPASWALFWLAR